MKHQSDVNTATTTRVLYCTHGGCWPPVQGDAVRVMSLIDAMRARGIQVHLAILHDATQPRVADYDALRMRCDGLSVYTPLSHERVDPSAPADDHCPDAYLSLCARDLARIKPHALIAQFSYLSRCLTLPGMPSDTLRVLDVDNILHQRTAAFHACGLEEDWIRITRRDELRCWQRAQVILTVQPADAGVVRRATPGAVVLTILPLLRDAPQPPSVGTRLLFVGADNPANTNGILGFCRHVLPVLVARYPQLRLDVIGSVCDAFARHSVSNTRVHPAIFLHGIVSDLTPHYCQATIVLNLVPAASGINVKLLEGMMHRRCVVSTKAGADALAIPGGVIIADSNSAFATLVGDLLHDVDRRERLAATGYAMARQWLHQTRPVEPLLDRIQSLSRRRNGRTTSLRFAPSTDIHPPRSVTAPISVSADAASNGPIAPKYVIVDSVTHSHHRFLLAMLFDNLGGDDICCLVLYRTRLLAVARVRALNPDVLYLDRVVLASNIDTDLPVVADLLDVLFTRARTTGKAVHGFPLRLLGISSCAPTAP